MKSTDPCPACANPVGKCTCACLKQLCCGAALYPYTHNGVRYEEGHFEDCPGYVPLKLSDGDVLTITFGDTVFVQLHRDEPILRPYRVIQVTPDVLAEPLQT